MLIDLLHMGADFVGNLFMAAIGQPLATDASFRAGFFWGAFLTALAGVIWFKIIDWQERIQRWFNPTRTPSNPGPIPRVVTVGCVVSAIGLIVAALAIVFVVVSIGQTIVGGG